MSRKKIVRKSEKMLTDAEKNELLGWVLTDPEKGIEVPALPAPEEKKEPELTKEQQMAKMLFNDLIKDGLGIKDEYENDYIRITPLVRNETPDVIECYEIVPKSNKNVMIYLTDEDILVSLKGATLSPTEPKLIYLAANMLNYIKTYYVAKAA